ncbi:MAG: tRNA pseudouridine(13) synthase TruD [Myxococcales bacterium]|nr:tRNA pseudouridine(13) synthase TruD [Myxococcales bacterium]
MQLPRVDFDDLPRCYEEAALVGLSFVPEVDSFFVEEIPLYLPCGEGEHLFLQVRKRGLNTNDVSRALAAHLGLPEDEIGTAGQKDRHATTTQWFSLPARLAEKLEDFSHEGIEILQTERHMNKLRTSHLLGNLFGLHWSALSDEQFEALERAMGRMQEEGMPNFFGPQRFGRGKSNHLEGLQLLSQMKRTKSRWRKRMMISAYQSACFNDLLAWRIAQGQDWLTPLEGDWMRPFPRGGALRRFPEGLERELARDAEESALAREGKNASQVEIGDENKEKDASGYDGPKRWVPTAQLPGSQVEIAEGIPGTWETALWEREGLEHEAFRRMGKMATGTRRLIAVWPWKVSVTREGQGARLFFALPAGSYASVLCAQMGMRFGKEESEPEAPAVEE